MLTRIKIQNIALLDEAELTFDKGLSVLTGETGAGKSVIVTALSLALGARAEREYIRHGAASVTVEACFDASGFPPAYRAAFAEWIVDGSFTVSRSISVNGSGKVKINGRSASLTQLKSLTAPMAEILSQHAGQMLMNEDNHLGFLDSFASLEPSRHAVEALYARWRKVADELAKIIRKKEQLHAERELLLFQKQEIERTEIRVGEEEELAAELKILNSSRNLMSSAALINGYLGDEETSAINLLAAARKEIEKMAAIDNTLCNRSEDLAELEFRVEELRSFIEQYGNSIPDDPNRIEEINLRLDEIYKLKKKYGGSEEAILSTLTLIDQKLQDRPDIQTLIDDLASESQKLFKEYTEKALQLSKKRQAAGRKLKKLVTSELAELAIDNGGFEFEFIYEDDPEGVIINSRAVKPLPHGLETGRILFSANPGEPLKSLVKTASGGEMSRVFLALKSAEMLSGRRQHSLMVFDEVDAGIGGRTATEVGKKLKKLAGKGQLLVVTHLHQIARLADHHYLADKAVTGKNRTTISVRQLTAKDIKIELERMVALPEPA